MLCGVNPVLEALTVSPPTIEHVLVARGARSVQPVVDAARACGVPIETVDQGTLDRMTGGAHHQGVAGRVPPFVYTPIEDLLGDGHALIVVLDGVTDPQNLGAIIRSAEVLGARGVVVPEDRAAAVTPTVMRAASGATAHLPVAQVVNLVRALESAKAAGFWIVGLDAAGSAGFQDLPPLERTVLVVGSEGKGMRRLVREACDFLVRIPVRGRVASLNASVAAGIGLFALVSRLGAGLEPGDR